MITLTEIASTVDRMLAMLNAGQHDEAFALATTIRIPGLDPALPAASFVEQERDAWHATTIRFCVGAGVLAMQRGAMEQAIDYIDRGLERARTLELLFYRGIATQRIGYQGEEGHHAQLATSRRYFDEILALHGGVAAVTADSPHLVKEAAKHIARIMTRIGPATELARVVSQVLAFAPDDAEFHAYQEEVQASLAPAQQERGKPRERVVSRYPDQDFFEADNSLIMKELIADSAHVPRFLTSASRFFCIGSCFAREIDIHLRKQGFTSFVTEIGETINNSYTNLILLKYVTTGECEERYRSALETMLATLGGLDRLRGVLAEADVVVFTLGVAPAFFDDQGHPVLGDGSAKSALSLSRRYRFRTTTVDENLANLHQIIALLRGYGTPKRIVLTVSPVPLRASFEYHSAIVADCVSKSTLRVVVDTLLREQQDYLVYWPSFEMVRWVSGHRGAVFGVDDGATAHISFKLIRDIVTAFVDRFRIEPA
jgi:hypothetical protein